MAGERAIRKYKKANIGLIIALSIVSALFILAGILYAVSMSRVNNLSYSIESIYQRNFYELVDNINNVEVKLSKVLASSDNDYQKDMLEEVSKSSSRASVNLSALPISINGLSDTIKFVNKVDGYTTSLVKKLDGGESLTEKETETLSKVHTSIVDIKSGLSTMTEKMYGGYSILEESLSFSGDYNGFTNAIGNVSSDIDYPSMIYDGPFSDSVVSKEIKGLNFAEVDESTARANLINILEEVNEEDLSYLGETNGQITTYDYSVEIGDRKMFCQMTKKGGRLINLSSYSSNLSTNQSLSSAITNAERFINKTGIENVECVWSDIINGSAYLNFARVINGVIIYPELIKVKIELGEGNITGFDALTYYTNQQQRSLSAVTFDATSAREKIPTSFKITEQRLALIPLDWNREVLCHEFVCTKDGATYYIYLNAQSGAEENILKVVETSNGNQLM